MSDVIYENNRHEMFFIGTFILLTLCPLYTVEACQVSNCLQCNDTSICNVCNDGYYLEAGSCLQCPTYCATCTSSTQCQTCLDTFWDLGVQCRYACYPGCTAAGCNDTTAYCYECELPGQYGPYCHHSCSRCVEGECNKYGCTKGCIAGYGYITYSYHEGYKFCLQCPPNCITCSNQTYCTQCKQGYYGRYYRFPSERGTMNCLQCDDRCTECTSTGHCPDCPPECIQQGCGVSGNCSTTTPTPTTIKLTSTSKAAACQVSNCLQCNDISVCNMCHGGYYLEAGSCKQCPTNCATCTNSTQCQTCLDTYWKPGEQCYQVCYSGCTVAGCNDTTGYCYECKPEQYGTHCHMSCSHCVEGDCDQYGCTKECNKGYVLYFSYINGDTGFYRSGYTECRQCPSNCTSCSNTTYCTQCEQGYIAYYYRHPTSGRGTMICLQCDDRCTECTSVNPCPEWCQSECIQQGCGVSGCNTTTPTPTTIELTSTSKEDVSTTIKSQESTPPATTKTTVCPTECMSGCDTQGRCHETTTIYSESDGPSAAPKNIGYHEGFGHGVATGSGIVIFIVVLIVVTCFLTRRTQCTETPCFAKTTATSKEQHVYYNTQTESGRTSNPRNTPDYVNADIVPPVQDSEYEINETGDYSSLDERQLEHQYSDLHG